MSTLESGKVKMKELLKIMRVANLLKELFTQSTKSN